MFVIYMVFSQRTITKHILQRCKSPLCFQKNSAYVKDSKNAHSIAFCNGSELFFGPVQGVPYQLFTVFEDYGTF